MEENGPASIFFEPASKSFFLQLPELAECIFLLRTFYCILSSGHCYSLLGADRMLMLKVFYCSFLSGSATLPLNTIQYNQGVEFTRRRAYRSDQRTHKLYITLIVEASGFGKRWSQVSIAMVTGVHLYQPGCQGTYRVVDGLI